MQFALTTHPLSTGFRRRLEETLLAPPEYLDYADLRNLSPLNFIRRLRSLGATSLLLPIEDDMSNCLLPLLKGVAALARTQSISIVHPDLRKESIGRASALSAAARLAVASAVAAWDMAHCVRELTALNATPLSPRPVGAGRTVLYINANLWFGMKAGGSIGHVAGVVNALAEGGRQVLLACPAYPPMVRPEVNVLRLRIPEVFGLPFEKSYYTFHRLVVDQLASYAFPEPPAFIYQRMSPANYGGVVLSRRWGIPLVLEYNGSEVWVGKNWGRGFRYPGVAMASEEACLRHADLVVTVSDVLVDELVVRGVSKNRIVWYPNCVDTTIFDPDRFPLDASQSLRRRLGIADDAVVVMFIGTFGPWHGVEVFAAAIRLMLERDGPRVGADTVHFVLVGDGLKMSAVRDALSGSAQSGFLTMTGLVSQDEAPQYLSIADVVVSPHVPNGDGSRFFGSPTKLYEYMAMGRAIVASNLDQIGQTLRPAVHVGDLPLGEPDTDEPRLAVLFSPGDAEGLVQGIRFAVSSRAWRSSLGRNARRRALAQYTWKHHLAAILAGLDALPAVRGSA